MIQCEFCHDDKPVMLYTSTGLENNSAFWACKQCAKTHGLTDRTRYVRDAAPDLSSDMIQLQQDSRNIPGVADRILANLRRGLGRK